MGFLISADAGGNLLQGIVGSERWRRGPESTRGTDALPTSMLAEYSPAILQRLTYFENILAGRASAPYVSPPCASSFCSHGSLFRCLFNMGMDNAIIYLTQFHALNLFEADGRPLRRLEPVKPIDPTICVEALQRGCRTPRGVGLRPHDVSVSFCAVDWLLVPKA